MTLQRVAWRSPTRHAGVWLLRVRAGRRRRAGGRGSWWTDRVHSCPCRLNPPKSYSTLSKPMLYIPEYLPFLLFPASSDRSNDIVFTPCRSGGCCGQDERHKALVCCAAAVLLQRCLELVGICALSPRPKSATLRATSGKTYVCFSNATPKTFHAEVSDEHPNKRRAAAAVVFAHHRPLPSSPLL